MFMKTGFRLLLLSVIVVTVLSSNFLVLAKQDELELTIIELKLDESSKTVYTSLTDDSAANPDYKLLRYHWYSTANYYINGANNYGFTQSNVEKAITDSANEWDEETSFTVFNYKGSTTSTAGVYDNMNIVDFGDYKAGVIGVTYIWIRGRSIVECDTILNTYYPWSLSGGEGKMDVQNIVTHEFGHWCGLADLYKSRDSWLTMYGYSNYGVTYQRTLGLGDILGLQKVYGP